MASGPNGGGRVAPLAVGLNEASLNGVAFGFRPAPGLAPPLFGRAPPLGIAEFPENHRNRKKSAHGRSGDCSMDPPGLLTPPGSIRLAAWHDGHRRDFEFRPHRPFPTARRIFASSQQLLDCILIAMRDDPVLTQFDALDVLVHLGIGEDSLRRVVPNLLLVVAVHNKDGYGDGERAAAS